MIRFITNRKGDTMTLREVVIAVVVLALLFVSCKAIAQNIQIKSQEQTNFEGLMVQVNNLVNDPRGYAVIDNHPFIADGYLVGFNRDAQWIVYRRDGGDPFISRRPTVCLTGSCLCLFSSSVSTFTSPSQQDIDKTVIACQKVTDTVIFGQILGNHEFTGNLGTLESSDLFEDYNNEYVRDVFRLSGWLRKNSPVNLYLEKITGEDFTLIVIQPKENLGTRNNPQYFADRKKFFEDATRLSFEALSTLFRNGENVEFESRAREYLKISSNPFHVPKIRGMLAEVLIKKGRKEAVEEGASLLREALIDTLSHGENIPRIDLLGQLMTADTVLNQARWHDLLMYYESKFTSGEFTREQQATLLRFHINHVLPRMTLVQLENLATTTTAVLDFTKQDPQSSSSQDVRESYLKYLMGVIEGSASDPTFSVAIVNDFATVWSLVSVHREELVTRKNKICTDFKDTFSSALAPICP